MDDKKINFDDLNSLMESKINIVKRKDNFRFVNFRDKILDIYDDNIKRFGVNCIFEELPFKSLCYHGCFFKQLIAFDKITNDRIDAIKNHKYSVKNIETFNESSEIKILQDMVDKCINYDINNIDKFLDYVLFIIGDKNNKTIDYDDKDIKFYYDNFKPVPLLFFPSGYFMNLTNWNYFGLDFNTFFNLPKIDIINIFDKVNFKDLNDTFKKILLVESYFYAPYIVTEINKYL